MLQQDEPDDFVIATGGTHSVRELVERGLRARRARPGASTSDRRALPAPAEVEHLVGDASKAREKLGWKPRTSFEEMIRLMVDSDLELLERGVPQKQAG